MIYLRKYTHIKYNQITTYAKIIEMEEQYSLSLEMKRFTEISVHRDSDVWVRFMIRFHENLVRFGLFFFTRKKRHKNARKMTKRNEKLRNRVS